MEQVYRSRLNALPVDLKADIASVVYQWGLSATNRRNLVMEAFNDYKIPVTELGTGTNRLCMKYSNFALKIALDDEGIDDNRQEWVMSDILAPDVAETMEISGDIVKKDDDTFEITGGHLMVAAYVPALANWSEMLFEQRNIEKILKRWSKICLLGDVGVTNKNYANWGKIQNQVKCIDYAYVFPMGMDLFKCTCGCPDLDIDPSFSKYICKYCKRQISDSELRARISNEKRHEFFSKVKGLKMSKEFEKFDVDMKYLHIERPREANMIAINNQNSEARDNKQNRNITRRRW
jgi:hypothetical protein